MIKKTQALSQYLKVSKYLYEARPTILHTYGAYLLYHAPAFYKYFQFYTNIRVNFVQLICTIVPQYCL